MIFDPNKHHVLMMMFVNFARLYLQGDFASLLFKIVDTLSIKIAKSDVYTRTCTQLTFDLILGLRGIS